MDAGVALSPRVTVIDGGRLIHDGDLRALVKAMMPDKRVSFRGEVAPDLLARLGRVVATDSGRTTLDVPEDRLREVIGHLLDGDGIGDLAIEDPPLEDVMRKLFKDHKPAVAPAADAAP